MGYYTVFRRWQWQFLLAANFVFYALSDAGNLVYIAAAIVTTYFASRRMARLNAELESWAAANPGAAKAETRERRAAVKAKRRVWLVLCLIVNLSALAVVKYAGFAIATANGVRAAFGAEPFQMIDFVLPMGISFFTFQSLGYIIDAYRGKAAKGESFFRLAAFVSFFPQLIQGPISRYSDLSGTLFAPHAFSPEDFREGLFRALCGFFKKLVVADRLFAAIRALTADPAEYPGVYVLVAMIAYAVTLYCDFTGGIDIAIGVARALGVRVAENFNRPFYSVSIADYWRRWHITMGTWFRDYLFYPLSLSKPTQKLLKLTKKTFGPKLGMRVPVYISTAFVWFATGLWHGASWNFIAWGVANGLVIIISQELSPVFAVVTKRFGLGSRTWWTAFRVVRTFWLMSFLRSFDIYANVGATFRAYVSVFSGFGASVARLSAEGLAALGLYTADYVVVGVSVALMALGGHLIHARGFRVSNLPFAGRFALFAAVCLAIVVFGAYGFGYDANQFIYNRF
ncbi:MAG: MBOAT family protein [Clostridiales bacterium]|nr:MBOAT family protein [Clostridiales bacterium]